MVPSPPFSGGASAGGTGLTPAAAGVVSVAVAPDAGFASAAFSACAAASAACAPASAAPVACAAAFVAAAAAAVSPRGRRAARCCRGGLVGEEVWRERERVEWGDSVRRREVGERERSEAESEQASSSWP